MAEAKEYTGGSVSYYAVDVNAPINEASDPYTAECQDIIEALKLDFNEGNVLKAIWRRAAARLGRSKKGYDEGLYDAEKIVFYGQRLVAIEQRAKAVTKRPDLLPREPERDELVLVECEDGTRYPAPKTWAENVKAKIVTPETDPYGPRDAEGWYTWNGDQAMRPAGKVDFVTRDGSMYCGSAEQEDWTHEEGCPNDIVKWRPAQ